LDIRIIWENDAALDTFENQTAGVLCNHRNVRGVELFDEPQYYQTHYEKIANYLYGCCIPSDGELKEVNRMLWETPYRVSDEDEHEEAWLILRDDEDQTYILMWENSD